jgi:hypothetical protein
LVVVTLSDNNILTYNDNSSLISTFGLGYDADWATEQTWMCVAYPHLRVNLDLCNSENMLPLATTWIVSVSGKNLRVGYCLSAGVADLKNSCGLHFSMPIMIIVCCMNLLKCLGVLYTLLLFWHGESSLVTLGDAISSFMVTRDHTTEAMCLATASDLQNKNWPKLPKKWQGPQALRVFRFANRSNWIITMGS